MLCCLATRSSPATFFSIHRDEPIWSFTFPCHHEVVHTWSTKHIKTPHDLPGTDKMAAKLKPVASEPAQTYIVRIPEMLMRGSGNLTDACFFCRAVRISCDLSSIYFFETMATDQFQIIQIWLMFLPRSFSRKKPPKTNHGTLGFFNERPICEAQKMGLRTWPSPTPSTRLSASALPRSARPWWSFGSHLDNVSKGKEWWKTFKLLVNMQNTLMYTVYGCIFQCML